MWRCPGQSQAKLPDVAVLWQSCGHPSSKSAQAAEEACDISSSMEDSPGQIKHWPWRWHGHVVLEVWEHAMSCRKFRQVPAYKATTNAAGMSPDPSS